MMIELHDKKRRIMVNTELVISIEEKTNTLIKAGEQGLTVKMKDGIVYQDVEASWDDVVELFCKDKGFARKLSGQTIAKI